MSDEVEVIRRMAAMLTRQNALAPGDDSAGIEFAIQFLSDFADMKERGQQARDEPRAGAVQATGRAEAHDTPA